MSEETEEIKKKGIRWSSEKIMSISALFISVVSVIALFYQLSLAREENELIRKQQSASVIPYLQFQNTYNVNSFNIQIVNKGVGPAFIKSVSFLTNNGSQFDDSTNALLHIMKNEVDKSELIGYNGSINIKKNTVIQAGKSVLVFEVSTKVKDDNSGVKSFKNYINNTPPKFSLEYEDIYGNRWELSNKKQKGFQFLTPVLIKKVE